jgi:hypothetical protein
MKTTPKIETAAQLLSAARVLLIHIKQNWKKKLDNEVVHTIEYDLMHRFIEMLDDGDITTTQMTKVAAVLAEIGRIDYGRWYG